MNKSSCRTGAVTSWPCSDPPMEPVFRVSLVYDAVVLPFLLMLLHLLDKIKFRNGDFYIFETFKKTEDFSNILAMCLNWYKLQDQLFFC
jgi:hypothetical protein